jgi:hypothetical protein
MDKPKEYRRMDTHELFLQLGRFIDDNKHSSDLPSRWLADKLRPLRETVRLLKGSGVKAMAQEEQNALSDFRLAEIEEEQSKLAKDQERLDNEAKRIRQAKAA